MTDTTSSQPASAPLDYAPAPPLLKSGWFRRVVIYCVLFTCFLGVWKYGSPVWHHVRVLWWQRTCMAYAQPPERVVYTDDRDEGKALHRTGEYLSHYAGGPMMLRDLPAYEGLSSEIGYDAGSGGAIAFMHERTNEKGQRRLVVVYVSRHAVLQASVFIPSTATARGKWGSTGTAQGFATGLPSPRRAFAGQVDPNDASSFTVRCEAGGVPRKVRGKLVGDAIQFSIE